MQEFCDCENGHKKARFVP